MASRGPATGGGLEHDPEKWKPFSEKIMLHEIMLHENGIEKTISRASFLTIIVNTVSSVTGQQGLSGLFRFRPCRSQRSADQRMLGELAHRTLDQASGPVGKVEPRLGHDQKTGLVGAIGGSVGEIEAGGGEASVVVYLIHSVELLPIRLNSWR